jgi:quinol monooxygenase YgiN
MPDTVHVIALFTAAPGREEELEQVLTGLLAPTRAEAGCRRYDLLRHRDGSGEFAFVEEWDSEEALERHFQTPHLLAAREQFPALVGAPTRLNRYREVS